MPRRRRPRRGLNPEELDASIVANADSAQPSAAAPVLSVRNLHVHLYTRRGEGRAVDGVSFDLHKGETLGLVGESGCGKSTVGRAIVNILRAMAYGVEIDGKILYHHPSALVDLASLGRSQMRPYRSDIQMIFQDPYSS